MAGQGIRLFSTGAVLTAAQINQYLMDQSIHRFATTTARATAYSAAGVTLAEGMFSYIDSTNKLYYYSGSAWEEVGAQIEAGEVTDTEVSATAAIAISKLASGTAAQVILANATGVPTYTTLSGDVTVSNTGVTAIGASKVTSSMIVDGTIVNGDISASAAIALSKLATSTAGNIIVYNSSGVPTAVAETGDVLVSDAGVTSIAAGVIVDADINASAAIVDTKLATIATAGKVSNSATTAASANTANAIVARDASGNFVAGKATLSTGDINTVIETASIVAAASTGTITIDFSTNPTVYYTVAATANWTLNVRGTASATLNNTIAIGQIATVTFLATNGVTPYRPTVFQVDGVAVTPKWMGGTAPSTGNASSIDAYTLAIIKTGSAAYTVLASQSKFA
jgi:hypothetical protein